MLGLYSICGLISLVATNSPFSVALGPGKTLSAAYYDLDNRYFTETEATDLFVNHAGDTMTGNLLFNDSVDIVMDSALTIGHDTASYITSTTPLTVTTDTFNLVSNTGTENMITAGVDGVEVEIDYSPVNIKVKPQ